LIRNLSSARAHLVWSVLTRHKTGTMISGCERSGSRESSKGASLSGVQGEELVNGSPVLGLLAVTGEGCSVRRTECSVSGCKGLMLG